MTDQDREAFEVSARLHYDLTRSDDGYYANRDTECLWKGWLGARAHYAPKVTESIVIERAAKAMLEAMAETQPFLSHLSRKQQEKHSAWKWEAHGNTYRAMAKAALKAAGMAFKEKA